MMLINFIENYMEYDEFKKQMVDKVMEKIKDGKPLNNLDVLILQEKYEIFDPSISAYRQISLQDYFNYVKSLNKKI